MGSECGCGEWHGQHLCELMKKETPIEELKQIVSGAQYICKNCGRAAAKEENLCAPEKL